MPQGINHATVIGAGTMGAAIAGHLANAGVTVSLLDVVPSELTPQEAAAGWTLETPRVRNRIVQAGFERMIKAKPINLFSPEVAQRIEPGNLVDDFERALQKSDWIIEAIVEQAAPKQALMARIEAVAPADAIISSNTSGIPIRVISEGRGAAFQRRFMGTHFFNPPRYLRLLEIIPTPATDPALVARLKTFAEQTLGKGVVIGKDTPNFIANRMFSYIEGNLIEYAVEQGYTVEEVDALTGSLLGRPNSATFRLHDIIGIDVAALVTTNLYPLIPHDDDRDTFQNPSMMTLFQRLMAQKLLGQKSGQGFYKMVLDDAGQKQFWGLNLPAAVTSGEIDYLPPQAPQWPSVTAARKLPLPERLHQLSQAEDRAGRLIWHTLAHTFAYASKRIPEIADSVADIDNVMKWGFGWGLGPFETWDHFGVAATVQRMAAEGIAVAPWVHTLLEQGHTHFYREVDGSAQVYNPLSGQYDTLPHDPQIIALSEVRRRPALAENEAAALRELGDGVLLLEFRSKLNVIDEETMATAQAALDRLHGNATGLVIGNDGQHFSVGANLQRLGSLAQAGDWQTLSGFLQRGQTLLLGLRAAPKPVVAAPFQRALGGGVEFCLAADRIVAHAESYLGLVETGVGIIPGWGGCKELVRRVVSPPMRTPQSNPTPYLRQIFETIGFAKVSTSALDARALGLLRETDRIVLNIDYLLAEARRAVLTLVADGYSPPPITGTVYAAGRDHLANFKIEIYSLQNGAYISEHDATIATRLAHVLCGGDLSAPAWMDEQYFLDLEREALLSLAGEAKTQARIWHMLKQGKPLRN